MTDGVSTNKTQYRMLAAVLIAAVCAAVSVACVAVPLYVIRPFRAQSPRALAVALTVRDAAPWISVICAIMALAVAVLTWKIARSRLTRVVLVAFSVIAIAAGCLTHVNVFEMMFHPYNSPKFGAWNSVRLDSNDMVLAVRIGDQARAYPIRTMGYHHIVNDTVGGLPIAVTYCTLCHTGLVWNRVLDSKTLYFRLTGINNGNALMRDEQTGTIWQQSTGQAIFGPLKGRQLELVRSNELTAALWHNENPGGELLKPDVRYASQYDPKDWESHIEKTRVVVDTKRSGVPPHELVLGISRNETAKAYPVQSVLAEKLVQDQIAGEPVLLVVGPDQTSIRVFQGTFGGRPTTFTYIRDANPYAAANEQVMTDVATGSVWNFQGCAVAGPEQGHCLREIDAHKDYWFDWLNHHPSSAIFKD
jgi:Protein of unknown function (DUF3179)